MTDREATTRHRYAAFISYSSRDRAAALRLHRRLEGYRVPRALRNGSEKRTQRRLFIDKEESRTGDTVNQMIEGALRDSRFLIVLCSPNAHESSFVDAEIRCFRKLDQGANILLLALSDADSAPERYFPRALLEVDQGDDIGRSLLIAHPLYSSGALGRLRYQPRAFLDVVAHLEGLSVDLLFDRHRQRAARRRRLSAVAAAAGIAGLVLAWDAWMRPMDIYYRNFVRTADGWVGVDPVPEAQAGRMNRVLRFRHAGRSTPPREVEFIARDGGCDRRLVEQASILYGHSPTSADFMPVTAASSRRCATRFQYSDGRLIGEEFVGTLPDGVTDVPMETVRYPAEAATDEESARYGQRGAGQLKYGFIDDADLNVMFDPGTGRLVKLWLDPRGLGLTGSSADKSVNIMNVEVRYEDGRFAGSRSNLLAGGVDLEFEPRNDIRYSYDEQGRLLARVYEAAGDGDAWYMPAPVLDPRPRVEFGYDDTGNVVTERVRDASGAVVGSLDPDAVVEHYRPDTGWGTRMAAAEDAVSQGVYMQYEHDETGRTTAVRLMSEDGGRAQIAGVHAVRRARATGEFSVSLFDAEDRPTTGPDGFHRMVDVGDAWSGTFERTYFGPAGEPAEDRAGIHRAVAETDAAGVKVSYSTDKQGRLVPDEEGVLRYRHSFDEDGRETERRHEDADGNLAPNWYGVARVSYLESGESCFDELGREVRTFEGGAYSGLVPSRQGCDYLDSEGIAGVVVLDAEGRAVRETRYFDGNPAEVITVDFTSAGGYLRRATELETGLSLVEKGEGGRVIEVGYLDGENRRTLGEDGFSYARNHYDGEGRLVRREWRLPDGSLFDQPSRHEAYLTVTYLDEDTAHVNFYDHRDNRIPRPWGEYRGISTIEYYYLEDGIFTTRYFLDADDEQVATWRGVYEEELFTMPMRGGADLILSDEDGNELHRLQVSAPAPGELWGLN